MLCFGNHLFIHAVPGLRLMASVIAGWLLNGFGVEVIREGTGLCSPVGNGFAFDVADGCSGLHSIVALTAIAAPYLYLEDMGMRRKWALFLLCVPMAIAANLIRILTMAGVMAAVGMDRAMSLWHDGAGYFVFFVAVFLFIQTHRMTGADWKTKWAVFRKKQSKS